MGYRLSQRIVELIDRYDQHNDGFPMVNLTVGLFALNCFLLAAVNVVPLPAQSVDWLAFWCGRVATLLVIGVAVVAFLYDCTWKLQYFALPKAAARFFALTAVLTIVIFLQAQLTRFEF